MRAKLLETAHHEAGHAVACLLEKRKIYGWRIVPDEMVTRKNRRVKTRELFQGSDCGELSCEWRDSDLALSLTGQAGEGCEIFLDPKIKTKMDLLNEYHEVSDEVDAWNEVHRLIVLNGGEPTDSLIIKCLNAAYTGVRKLYKTPVFETAIAQIGQYMMEKGTEQDDRISERMQARLRQSGISLQDLKTMKKNYTGLNMNHLIRTQMELAVAA